MMTGQSFEQFKKEFPVTAEAIEAEAHSKGVPVEEHYQKIIQEMKPDDTLRRIQGRRKSLVYRNGLLS